MKHRRIGVVLLGKISSDSGGQTYALNFLRAASKIANLFVFASHGQEQLFRDISGLKIILIPSWSTRTLGRLFAEQFVVPYLAEKQALHSIYFPNNFISLFSRIPCVVAIRSMLIFNKRNSVDRLREVYRTFLSRFSALFSIAIITPSWHTKDEILRFLKCDAQKIHVVPHGLNSGVFFPGSANEAVLQKYGIKRKYILYVSSLWKFKRHDCLVRAFAKIKKDHHIPHDLVLVGRGVASHSTFVAQIMNLIRLNHLESDIHMIDFIPHQDLSHIYRAADLFVFPSETESFGHPLYEAMATGTPVVCSSSHQFPRMLGDAAIYADPDNLEEFSEAIFVGLYDHSRRTTLVQNGIRLTQKLSWERTAQETIDIIEGTRF